MLAYGKNMPRNNKFSVFLPRKSKILPKIKICPIALKIYPKTQNFPSHRVPQMSTKRKEPKMLRQKKCLNPDWWSVQATYAV